MEKDLSSLNRDVSAVIHLTGNGGGNIFLAYVDGCKLIEPVDHRNADISVSSSLEAFERLITHQLDPLIGLSTGQFKVTGNVMLALSLFRSLR